LINGPVSDQNSSFLRFGQLGVLQPYIERGEIKIIYDQMVNAWTREEGYRAGMECLKVSHVEAIIAGNDLLAGGVIQALEEKNLAGKVLIAGQDADKEARENIIKGIQAVTIYKSIEDLATNAARIAVDLAMGKPINAGMTTVNNGLQMVPALLLNPTLVNKGNIGLEVEVKPAN
jgi:D-xylose transport system substrate-binding protein